MLAVKSISKIASLIAFPNIAAAIVENGSTRVLPGLPRISLKVDSKKRGNTNRAAGASFARQSLAKAKEGRRACEKNRLWFDAGR
jgi:hypothetical protein